MGGLFRGLRLTKHVGVDLGSSSVKVAAFNRKKITIAALQELTPVERAEESVLIKKLNDFFRDTGISGRDAVISIPGTFLFIRTINFPAMPDSELKDAVRWEIKRQLPYPEDEAVYDYISKELPEGIVVTFAAAERKNINRYTSIINKAGLNVVAVDIAPLALLRLFNLEDHNNVIILDIGARHLEISIVRSGVLRLTRTVEMGGESIINYLLNNGKSHEDAMRILYNGDAEAMKEPLNNILREVTRSIDYYKANFKEKIFSRVINTGGICLNHNIDEYFASALNMPVDVADPFENYILKDEQIRKIGPRLSVALGLARRTD